MRSFSDFWNVHENDIIENCENRLDEYDAKEWLELAYKAGWDACRDKWSGMTYDETKEYGF